MTNEERKHKIKLRKYAVTLYNENEHDTNSGALKTWLKMQRIKHMEDGGELSVVLLNYINSEYYLRKISYRLEVVNGKPVYKGIELPVPNAARLRRLRYLYGPQTEMPRITMPNAKETIDERKQRLADFMKNLKNNDGIGHSREWKAMKAALQRAIELNSDIRQDDMGKDNGVAEKKQRLAAAMETLKRTAHDYAMQKIGQSWEPDDGHEELMKLAGGIYKYAEADLKQTEAVEELENRKIYTDGTQIGAFKQIKQEFDDIQSEYSRVSSAYRRLKKVLDEICEKSTGTLAYNNKIEELKELTDNYIEHKQKHNDAGAGAMRRYETTLRLEHLIRHLEKAKKAEEAEKAGKAKKIEKLPDPYVEVPQEEAQVLPVPAEHKAVREKRHDLTDKLKKTQNRMISKFKRKHDRPNPDEDISVMSRLPEENGMMALLNIPKEILVTGDQAILNDYLQKNQKSLTENEKKHLQNRVEVMNYLDDLEQFYNSKEGRPQKFTDKDIVTTKDGYTTLKVKLSRRQDNFNGCWGCAYSLLLQARGVNVDQTIIRRYRPKFTLGEASNLDVQSVFYLNSDSGKAIGDYGDLMDKLCPNTVMKSMDVMNIGGDKTAVVERAKKFVYSMLLKKSPVAVTNGNHWVTITGYDGKGNFRVVDSLHPQRKDLTSDINLDSYINAMFAKGYRMKFVALDDLEPRKGISIGDNDHEIKFKNDSENITPGEKSEIDVEGHGTSIVDFEKGISIRYPAMQRDFDVDYNKQRKAVSEKLRQDYKAPKFEGFHDNQFGNEKDDVLMDAKFTGKAKEMAVPQ